MPAKFNTSVRKIEVVSNTDLHGRMATLTSVCQLINSKLSSHFELNIDFIISQQKQVVPFLSGLLYGKSGSNFLGQ